MYYTRAGASRRLIGAAIGTLANQRDLPEELRHKYKAEKVVGAGSFGEVYLAEKCDTKQLFAMKVM